MADATDTVELLFVDDKILGLPKSLLISHSEYFRALYSGNFRDSNERSHSFPDVSYRDFSILSRYMTTAEINVNWKEIESVKNALLVANALCIDSYPRDLQKKLLSLSDDVDTRLALELAVHLKFDKEYIDKCYEECFTDWKGPSYVKRNKAFCCELLTLITSRKELWHIERECDCFVFLWSMTELIENVLRSVPKDQCDLQNIRKLLKNLNLESVPWNSLKMLLHDNIGSLSNICPLVMAVQHHFGDLRERIGKMVSAIRVCYRWERRNSYNYGIIEFDLDTWSWIIRKEVTTPYVGKFCVMYRDYANIFGDTGQMIFRMKNRNPKVVDNLYISEMCKGLDPFPCHLVASCVLGQFIYFFVYHQHPETHSVNNALSNCSWYSRPTLFKLNVFSQEFDDCAWFPVVAATIVAEGNRVYIAGFSPNSNGLIKVFCYNTTHSDTRTIAEFKSTINVGVTRLVLALKRNLLYIFFKRSYCVVDTRRSMDQPLQENKLECFFTQGWDFTILSLCVVDDGIVFLLDIDHRSRNCYYLGIMVAFLNTKTSVFQSLGFLPNPIEDYGYNLLYSPLQVQIERRKPSMKQLISSETFVEGIKDLENKPHKYSYMYVT